MCPSKKREGELDTIYPPSVALASDSSFQSRNRGSLKEEENGFRSMLGGNKVKQSRGEEQSSGSADSVNSGIVHSGYLVKEGGGESGIFSRKSWKRRWIQRLGSSSSKAPLGRAGWPDSSRSSPVFAY